MSVIHLRQVIPVQLLINARKTFLGKGICNSGVVPDRPHVNHDINNNREINNNNSVAVDILCSSNTSNHQKEILQENHFDLKGKKGSPSYIFNKDVAAEIAAKVLEARTAKGTPIIEYNPGPGLLTTEFLRLGAKQVIGIEARKEFIPYLEDLQASVGKKRFTYHLWDPFMAILSDSKRMDTLLNYENKSFSQIQHRDWNEDPYSTIFGILTPKKASRFVHLLVTSLGGKESIYSFGRPELFLLVPARNYRTMRVKAPNLDFMTYRKTSTIWSLFFDIETLMELKKTDVFPRFTTPRRFKSESKAFGKVNKDSIFFVKIVPKKTSDSLFSSSEDYSKFLIFLDQILQKKANRLIPKMESWLPGSGIHLIRMGFTMVHLTGEVSPEQYLQIFKELQKWPEYAESSLQAILSSPISVHIYFENQKSDETSEGTDRIE